MGFLNPGYDDDYRIANMPGTTDIPAAGALEGSLSAIPKGLASGFSKLEDMSHDIAQTDAGQQLLNIFPLGKGIQEMMSPQDKEKAHAAAQIVGEWGATGQDPRVTGSVGRILTGTSEGLTIGGTGALVGPWGAAALLGTTEAHASYKEGLKQGLSPGASEDQAALTGLFSAAGALVPMKFGKTALTSILGGSATNLALGATQRGLTAAALEADGFPEQAKQYRIFDGEAMAADAILGGAFGAMGHFTHPDSSRTTNPADVDAALAVSAEDHFNRSAPGIPTDPATATLHASTMADAIHSLANGELPDVPPEHAQEIVDNVIPDPVQSLAAPVPPEYTYTETRGTDDRFHGTSKAMPGDMPNNDYAMSGDNRNIFGQGFYTTDAADVAHGYMKKGRGGEPVLYRVKERPGVKLYDMEKPLTPEIKTLAQDIFGDYLPQETVDGTPINNLREMYNEFRAESQNNGLSRDDVQGYFDSFRYELEKLGYNGFRHIGGAGSEKYAPHDVRIYWTPEDHLDVSRANLGDYRKIKTPEKPSPLHEAALEDVPGYAEAAADVPRVKLPPEESPPPRAEPEPKAAGESAQPADVPLDPYHQDQLDHLVHNYGDAPYLTDDGREVTIRQMADELQQQRNEAKKFAALHEIAAACAVRNGL